MPAIQLARLKLQVGKLIDLFYQPADFVRALREMLSFYANYTHRPGQSGEPPPIIHTYNVPAPVIRQTLQEIIPLVKAEPDAAFLLCDKLWEQENLECRQIAASILGALPVDPAEPVSVRLHQWLLDSEEKLVEILLEKGMARLRQEDSASFIRITRRWVTSGNWREQQLGLRALVYPLKEGSFDDLPVLFQLITPLARNAPSVLRPHLVRLFSALARRSPAETVYFLRENLDFPDTPWLARHLINDFPPDLQEKLRNTLRSLQRR